MSRLGWGGGEEALGIRMFSQGSPLPLPGSAQPGPAPTFERLVMLCGGPALFWFYAALPGGSG